MHPHPLFASRIHELARARAHELREQALDTTWAAARAALRRGWQLLARAPRAAILQA